MVSFKAVAGCSYVSRQLFYVYFIAILSENQIEKIHFTALKILQVVGVNFHNYEALKIFEKAGAIVDFRSENVKITENLIKYALAQAPSEFCMYEREMEKEYVWGDSELKLGTGGSVINI